MQCIINSVYYFCNCLTDHHVQYLENFGLGYNYNGDDYDDDNDEYKDFVYDYVDFVTPVVILPGPISGSQTAVKRRNVEKILITKSNFFGGLFGRAPSQVP